MPRRPLALAAVAALAAAAPLVALMSAQASSPQLATVVSPTPVAWTPNVSASTTVGQTGVCNSQWFGTAEPCQSEVYGTAYVNGDVVAVGAFTEACKPGTLGQGLCTPGSQVTRDDIFAYQAGTIRHMGDCLDTSGSQLVLNPCGTTPATSQIWTSAGPAGNNELVQKSSGLCLTIPGDNTANGTQLDVEHCSGLSYQAWRLPTI